MELKITKASNAHHQYFKKEILEKGVGYVVSDKTSIVGLFSYTFEKDYALLNFTFVFNMQAIELAVKTFLEDYPDIQEIHYQGNQNLSKIGFKQKIYQRGD